MGTAQHPRRGHRVGRDGPVNMLGLMLGLGFWFSACGLAFSEGLLIPALLAFVLYEVMSAAERAFNARRPSASSVL